MIVVLGAIQTLSFECNYLIFVADHHLPELKVGAFPVLCVHVYVLHKGRDAAADFLVAYFFEELLQFGEAVLAWDGVGENVVVVAGGSSAMGLEVTGRSALLHGRVAPVHRLHLALVGLLPSHLHHILYVQVHLALRILRGPLQLGHCFLQRCVLAGQFLQLVGLQAVLLGLFVVIIFEFPQLSG